MMLLELMSPVLSPGGSTSSEQADEAEKRERTKKGVVFSLLFQ